MKLLIAVALFVSACCLLPTSVTGSPLQCDEQEANLESVYGNKLLVMPPNSEETDLILHDEPQADRADRVQQDKPMSRNSKFLGVQRSSEEAN
ncbi:uncharacterized protein LOC118465994 isoform X2 [Anopheles albimanus]|uniref:Uncharacterized protein n=1 Tax=Anopheles albimanus TaxID=7167 RepID=A0A182FTM1_ANOAL|nr:uncharacterized protein LOC118465994 isoform X2 [Anopheles albimanus]